jgi:hypothetical protein
MAGACALIFLLAKRFASFPASTIAALGFAVAPINFPFGFEFRPHTPALLFDLAGIFVFGLGIPALPIASFTAAFFTKQYSIAGIAGVLLCCVISGQRKRAAVLLAGWCAAIALATFVLQAWNPYYLLNTFESHGLILDWGAPFRYAAGTGLWQLPLIAPALMTLRRVRVEHRLAICSWAPASRVCSRHCYG